MDRFVNAILKHRKTVVIVFLAIAAVCVVLQMFVGIDYDLVDYLPKEAQSTKALAIMNQEFAQSMPNASVMVKDVTLMQAKETKRSLAAIPGVTQVLWLDDVFDIALPLETGDADTIRGFYRDGDALFSVTIAKGMEKPACAAILVLIGADGALTGEAPDLVSVQNATVAEVLKAAAILVPIFLLILILSTTSWIEPLLFLAAIGISILINMGTSVFLGRISFMTNSVSPILQLACSLDYAIFLLHSFSDNRKKYPDVAEAMRHAVRESMSTIAASAATTLFGFLALVFMKFGIGSDLGVNLAKGIVLSFISVMVFLPALTLLLYRLVDRTRHRELMPSFQNVDRVLSRIAVPMVLLVALLVVPSFLGQRQTSFTYGNSIASANTRNERDSRAIEAVFGKSTVVALLVPRGEVMKERDLSRDVGQLEHVTAVVSYAEQVGTALPPEFLDEGIVDRFYSANHARIIVYTDTPQEGDVAFRTVESIQAAARVYYGDAALSVGPSASLLDMKNVVKTDNTMVNAVAVVAIFLVLLLTFRSLLLPLFLLLTIETAIWINLSIPYFTGSPINFIGFLVISTVQLGATVDYAILLTTRYRVHRSRMPKREAMHAALGENFRSILVSGATLAAAGFTLFATSSNPAISGLGLLLGRGTLLSVLMVTCFLPGLLILFDKAIRRTTYKADFFGPAKAGLPMAKAGIPLEEEHED